MGENLIIVTNDHDAVSIYSDTKSLSWAKFLKRIAGIFGIDKSQEDMFWHQPTPGEERYFSAPNPKNESLVVWGEARWKQRLYPGEYLEKIWKDVSERLQSGLNWKNLGTRCSSKGRPTMLMDLCAETLITEVTRNLFGELIYDIEPSLTQYIYDLNEENWKFLLFSYPSFAAKRAAKAKAKISHALMNYAQSPAELCKDPAGIVRAYINEHESAGCNNQTIAGLLCLTLFGYALARIWSMITDENQRANLNVYRLNYWMLSYILRDRDLLETIRTEIAPAFQTHAVDSQYIYNSCPRLCAVWFEALRLTFGGVSVRDVTAPVCTSRRTSLLFRSRDDGH